MNSVIIEVLQRINLRILQRIRQQDYIRLFDRRSPIESSILQNDIRLRIDRNIDIITDINPSSRYRHVQYLSSLNRSSNDNLDPCIRESAVILKIGIFVRIGQVECLK